MKKWIYRFYKLWKWLFIVLIIYELYLLIIFPVELGFSELFRTLFNPFIVYSLIYTILKIILELIEGKES